ncbi:MAG: hypothetical protein NT091_04935, partial [Candidatus Falkowbacteria bacterium]|nr:hypothetical protein [Candidatus Falkowbacteria bacterium]
MKRFLLHKVLFTSLFLILGILGVANAGTSDNIYGYAWSPNFGWVSFNCTNTFSCGTVNHGVNVD